MSDKDLDLLFTEKFNAFEPEVPPALWNRITEELEEEKGKVKSRKFPVYRMAAACAVIVLSVAVWMRQEPGTGMKLHGKASGPLAGVKPVEPTIAPEPLSARVSASKLPATAAASVKPEIAAPVKRTLLAKQADPVKIDPVSSSEEQLQPEKIAAAPDYRGADHDHTAHIPSELGSVAIQNSFRTNTQVTAPVIAAVDMDKVQPRKKIKSLSGLVNFVVGKVDRRENKLIEMADGDEGTEVTSINLGLFKIKGTSISTNTGGNTANTSNAPNTIIK